MAESFTPRDYQAPLFDAREGGCKRFVTVWHRRAGKDLTWLAFVVREAFKRVGAYYYVFPTYTQGKKILWDGRDKEGRRFLEYIPAELVEAKNNSELKITLANGSTIQVIGADNPDSVVGTNPVGIVFSEFSLQRPTVWDLMRPILAENGGWAGFNYTPRGHNHGYALYEMARGNPDWYTSLLSVDDTGAVAPGVIESERQAGMAEPMIRQEFYVSFEAGQVGTYYGDQMVTVMEEGRVESLPWSPSALVYTAWDLGMDDHTAIGFFQIVGHEWRWIDYYESSGKGLDHYVKVLKDKPYAYETHYFPHDTKARELGTGKSREEVLRTLGIRPTIVAQQSVEDGMSAVRAEFPRFHFDSGKCAGLVDALRSYRQKWDDDLKSFTGRPLHDWASHPADMVRYAVMGHRASSSGGEYGVGGPSWAPLG